MPVSSPVPAIVAAQFRKIIRSFETSQAYTVQTARSTAELGIRHNLIFSRLVRHGVIAEAGTGRYYLDREKLDEYLQMRRRIVLFVLLIVALAVLIANFSGFLSR